MNIKDKFQRTALHHASRSGNITAIGKLVGSGVVDVNAKTYGDETPLMFAADVGR